MNYPLIVWTTAASREEAAAVGRHLVQHGLAACVQIDGPIQSIYRWQNQIEQAEEWRCVIKTVSDRYSAVEEAILRIHSYDVPQIIAVRADHVSAMYGDWLAESTAGDGTET